MYLLFFIKVITRNPNGISVDMEMENSKRTYDISRFKILLFGTSELLYILFCCLRPLTYWPKNTLDFYGLTLFMREPQERS